jgi:SPP1 family predicted phage head-tail adaptor
VRAGKLRHRLGLQRPVSSTDGQGGLAVVWTLVVTVWGELIPVMGVEREIVGQMASEATHSWSIRYSDVVEDISVKDRWFWDGRIFQILTVFNRDARNDEFFGSAKELTA